VLFSFTRPTRSSVPARTTSRRAYREGWMPTAGSGGMTRDFSITANQAHGSGAAYTVVHHHRDRRRRGRGERLGPAGAQTGGPTSRGCASWTNLRHDVTGKDPAAGRVGPPPSGGRSRKACRPDGTTHPASLFMEDTGWPHARAGTTTIRMWERESTTGPLSKDIADTRYSGVLSGGTRKLQAAEEAMLWQKISAGQRPTRRWSAYSLPTSRPEHRGPGHVHVRGAEVPRPVGEPGCCVPRPGRRCTRGTELEGPPAPWLTRCLARA